MAIQPSHGELIKILRSEPIDKGPWKLEIPSYYRHLPWSVFMELEYKLWDEFWESDAAYADPMMAVPSSVLLCAEVLRALFVAQGDAALMLLEFPLARSKKRHTLRWVWSSPHGYRCVACGHGIKAVGHATFASLVGQGSVPISDDRVHSERSPTAEFAMEMHTRYHCNKFNELDDQASKLYFESLEALPIAIENAVIEGILKFPKVTKKTKG